MLKFHKIFIGKIIRQWLWRRIQAHRKLTAPLVIHICAWCLRDAQKQMIELNNELEPVTIFQHLVLHWLSSVNDIEVSGYRPANFGWNGL